MCSNFLCACLDCLLSFLPRGLEPIELTHHAIEGGIPKHLLIRNEGRLRLVEEVSHVLIRSGITASVELVGVRGVESVLDVLLEYRPLHIELLSDGLLGCLLLPLDGNFLHPRCDLFEPLGWGDTHAFAWREADCFRNVTVCGDV